MRSLIIFILFILPAIGLAQIQCKEYTHKIKEGYQYLKSNDPATAYKLFNNAQKIGIAKCNLKSTIEAEEGMVKAFDALNKLKESAENAKKEIELQFKKIKERDNQIEQLKESSDKQEKQLRAMIKADRLSRSQDTSTASIDKVMARIKESNVSDINNPDIKSASKSTKNYSSSDIFSTPVFAQAKYIIDSVWNFYKINHGFSNNENNEERMSNLIKRLDFDINFNTLAKHLLDSTKTELKKIKSPTSRHDFTVYIYLRAVLYYSWNLSLKGKDSLVLAKTTLDEAAAYCKRLTQKSAIIYSGMAGLYNSYNNYYGIVDDTSKLAFEAIKTALDYGTIALRLNPGNYLYQRGLATLIRNTTYISGSQLSLIDKVELARLSYKCLKNMEVYFPYSGNSLTELLNSSTNLANRLMDVGFYTNAADTLKNTIEVFNQYIAKKSTAKDIELSKLRLLIKTSGIYVDSLNSFNLGIKYLNESYALFTAIKQDTADNVDANRLVELNSSLDNLVKFAKSKQDSLSAIKTFSDAILAFEKISPLGRSKYKVFSEDMYRFAQPYVRRLELNILRNNKEEANKDFSVLEKIFFQYYYKYRFDFYLGQPLIRASKVYANYLCGQGRYKQALPLLKFASLEGIKESTDSLIAIYQKPGLVNADSLKFYKNRTSYQSNGMKRFTVPTDFNGVKFPFNVYISDRAKEYDTMYTGIKDQVQWVWKARQGKVPEDVISSFDKLQKIAWENDVSFMDLSVYALGAAIKDSVKTKEYNLKKEIENKNILSLLTLSKQYAEKNDYVAIDTIYKEIKIKVADLYNSLCWESILSKKFNDAMFYVTEGLKYDPNSIFLKGNVPHIALLTDNIEKAKKLYLSYKNDPFNKDYKTYKDAFLADFQEFEKVGIVNENIKEIIRLLNEK